MHTQQIWRRTQRIVLVVALHTVIEDTAAATKHGAAILEHVPGKVDSRTPLNAGVTAEYALRYLSQLCLQDSIGLVQIAANIRTSAPHICFRIEYDGQPG